MGVAKEGIGDTYLLPLRQAEYNIALDILQVECGHGCGCEKSSLTPERRVRGQGSDLGALGGRSYMGTWGHGYAVALCPDETVQGAKMALVPTGGAPNRGER